MNSSEEIIKARIEIAKKVGYHARNKTDKLIKLT